MISNPDTIVDPWTVVIHLDDTSLAYRAVVSSFWLERVASSTKPLCLARWRIIDESISFAIVRRSFLAGVIIFLD